MELPIWRRMSKNIPTFRGRTLIGAMLNAQGYLSTRYDMMASSAVMASVGDPAIGLDIVFVHPVASGFHRNSRRTLEVDRQLGLNLAATELHSVQIAAAVALLTNQAVKVSTGRLRRTCSGADVDGILHDIFRC